MYASLAVKINASKYKVHSSHELMRKDNYILQIEDGLIICLSRVFANEAHRFVCSDVKCIYIRIYLFIVQLFSGE